MILVTGAAGKTGRAVLGALRGQNEPVRGMVHRPSQAGEISELGVADLVAGDLLDRSKLIDACQGIRAIYHIPPNMCPDEITIGESIIDCAQNCDVEWIVYHSVLHPQVEGMAHHWRKMRVEELLFQSTLKWTVLQPAVYMQNILGQWDSIQERGVYEVPYAVDTQLSFVDLEDVAEVAATVLRDPGHYYAIYELVGMEALSAVELAQLLSEIFRKPISPTEQARESWAQAAAEAGLGQERIQALLAMFNYYEDYNFYGNPNVCQWLLGRPPTTMRESLLRQIDI